MSRAVPRFRRSNPPLPPTGGATGVVVYKIIGSIEGQLTVSTFMYSAAVPAPSAAILAALLTAISTNLQVRYRACISADWTLTKETLDVIHRNDIIGAVSTVGATLTGSRAAGHEPTEVAAVILRFSNVKGQHGRGRVSLPAVSTTDVVASAWFGVGITAAFNALAVNMLLTASDGVNTWTPCIAQRGIIPPHLVVGQSPLTRVTPNTLLGTIRRRKIGRGK